MAGRWVHQTSAHDQCQGVSPLVGRHGRLVYVCLIEVTGARCLVPAVEAVGEVP